MLKCLSKYICMRPCKHLKSYMIQTVDDNQVEYNKHAYHNKALQ